MKAHARIGLLIAGALLLSACGDGDKKDPGVSDAGADVVADVPDTPDTDSGTDAPGDGGDASDVPDTDASDAEEDTTPPPPAVAPTPEQVGVDPNGVDVPAAVEEGQVLAGVAGDDAGGFFGVEASCKAGDFLLANAHARYCIEGTTTTTHLFFDGGRLIDAMPAGAPVGDRLHVHSTFAAVQTGAGREVEVIQDGSDGLAVVRVKGPLEPIMYFAGAVGPALFQPKPIDLVTEYKLRADSPVMEMVTFYSARGQATNISPGAGDLIFWGDTMQYVYPGNGTSAPANVTAVLGYADDIAYGWFSEDATQSVDLPGLSLPAVPLSVAAAPLAEGQTVSHRRWFVVARSSAQVIQALSEYAPEHPAAVEGVAASVTVTQGGEPLRGAKVDAIPLQAGQPVGEPRYDVLSGPDGVAALFVRSGEYRLEVRGPEGARTSMDIELAEGGSYAVAVPEVGAVTTNITELIGEETVASPARLRLTNTETQERKIEFVLRGTHTVRVAPGTWRYQVSRGSEFTHATGELEVAAGEEVTLTAQIERVVPTPGYIAGEFHQHSTASLDSEASATDRVLGNLAEGVDFAVSSDHDIATDFTPIIEELGARDLIATVAGVEVSPIYGHFGAYPVRQTATVSRGAPPLAYKNEDGSIGAYLDGASLLEYLRNYEDVRLIQSNHPRDSTGYFDRFNYDRETGEADDDFSFDFDTMEVINGEECTQFQDWLSFIAHGHRVIGIGNSDTHGRNSPPGMPRNYIASPTDDPAELTEDSILDGTLAGDVTVSSVAYLEIGGEARPWQVHQAAQYEAPVRVLTPPWAEATELRVIRNGVLWETYEIGGGEGEVTDFDSGVALTPEDGADSWFVILALNPERAQAVYPGERIFAFSNPIFLDVDGDGEFTSPAFAPIDEASVPFCQ